MGFGDTAEKAVLYGNVQSVEEALYYIVKDRNGVMEHEFVSENI